MKQYIFRRLFLLIPTLIGITFLTFFITRFVPGGPIEQTLMEMQFSSQSSTSQQSTAQEGLSEEELQNLKKFYGLDKPILVAYIQWLGKVVQFDFGTSYRYNESVWKIIRGRLPVSLFYGIITTLLAYFIAIPLGIYKALKHNTWIDSFSSMLIFSGYAIPAFLLGLLLLSFVSQYMPSIPINGFTSDEFDSLSTIGKIIDILHHSILPLICYTVGSFAAMTLLMKNSLLDNLHTNYIRTAFAKGLPKRRIIYVHALRNSLIPLAATFGHNISLVFTGSYLIETVFNINGLGLLGYQAVTERDYPVVLGSLLFSSFLFLFGNLLSDLCLATVDPRIRFN